MTTRIALVLIAVPPTCSRIPQGGRTMTTRLVGLVVVRILDRLEIPTGFKTAEIK